MTGSGNGMIKSLLEPVGLPCSATSATISIIRGLSPCHSLLYLTQKRFLLPRGSANCLHFNVLAGRTRSLDVATIKQGSTKFFSVLMLAWGMQVT